jgi:23S rRNA (cytidine1920-2'-O)/16S rRNA (cytidine1409-2'-O)-methyltransferase
VTPPDAAGTRRPARFVSRGGDKLQAALERLGVDPSGRRALDAGASTGGFTDCLLANGASHVAAVDVAYGELEWTLRNDPRVTVVERTNVRSIVPEAIGGRVGVVVADLAFISLRTVSAALVGVCEPGADLVLLVKPQFEAPRNMVERGGVVRDPVVWRDAVAGVVSAYRAAACTLAGACASPLVGPAGNREFFVHLVAPPGAEDASDAVIDAAVGEAP